MAVELRYSIGDPDYLKVVVLSATLKLSDSLFSKQDGHPTLSLRLDDNVVMFSANEVCRFLCGETGNEGFCGEDPTHQALVDYWLGWEASELKLSVKATLCGGAPTEGLSVCLGRLESHMTTCGGEFLIQDRLSLADVVIWSTLYALLAPDSSESTALHKDYPLVCRWFISLARRDHFTSAVWKASNDVGFDAFRDFIKGSKKPASLPADGDARVKLQAKSKGQSTKVSKPGAGRKLNQPAQKKEQAAETHHVDPPPDHVISASDLEAAKKAWLNGVTGVPPPREREHPILPVPGERNILITSALPYVNNVPHLGNIIGCVLSADVFARYCRLCNYNTLYICGTDEYGTATETKALEEKLTPQLICEKYYAIHDAIYKWFNIDFDYFGRTSTPQQTQIAQDIFWRLHERGFITKDKVDQLLCENCNMFLADRFVEGTCPICAYQDARGDQCDKCGRLINATELKSPRCKMCSSEPKIQRSDHLFLDLSQLAPRLHKWIQVSSSEGQWSSNAEHITSSWLRDGLKPRCITRDLKWGTPVPLEGYQDKVFYVWFDAPIGYLSITACYTDEWEKWWKNPKQVENFQFMAKDNVPFHTVVFPCSLLGTEDNYTLLNHISSTEYLNYEDGKFSKSRGVGVFGNDAKDTNIPPDVYRFYLLYVRPETQDSAFNWSDFIMKNNSELLNNLGNFVNRVLMFTKNNFNSTIQDTNLTEKDVEFIAKVTIELRNYLCCLDKIKIRDGLRHILAVSRLGNVHIQENKPWVLVKGSPEDRARAGSLLGVCANVVCLLSVMMQPYMPQVSRQIQDQLQAPPECNVLVDRVVPFLLAGHKIGTPSPLFTKIEESTAQALKEKFAGKRTFDVSSKKEPPRPSNVNKDELDKQAALVRQLKSQGDVAKEKIDEEVKKLLELKSKLGLLPSKGSKKNKSKK